MNSGMTKRLDRLEQESGTTIEMEIEKLPYEMKVAILARVREEIAARKAAGFGVVPPSDGDDEAQKIGMLRNLRDEYLRSRPEKGAEA